MGSSSKHHFPKHKNLGSITEIIPEDLPDFDLLVGGFPCQDLSVAGKRAGLAGSRSGLFYQALKILQVKKPKWFIIENVASMATDQKEAISAALGVEPVLINSALVTAQQRKRLFWCNFPVSQPEDRHFHLIDVLQKDVQHEYRKDPPYWIKPYNPDRNKPIKLAQYGKGKADSVVCSDAGKSYALNASNQSGYIYTDKAVKVGCFTKRSQGNSIYDQMGKSFSLCASRNSYIREDKGIRRLSPVECERLQGFPDGWTEGTCKTRRQKAMGNAVTVPVVEHLVKCLQDHVVGW